MRVIEIDDGSHVQISRSKDGDKIDMIYVSKEKARSMRSNTELINTLKKDGHTHDRIKSVMEEVSTCLEEEQEKHKDKDKDKDKDRYKDKGTPSSSGIRRPI